MGLYQNPECLHMLCRLAISTPYNRQDLVLWGSASMNATCCSRRRDYIIVSTTLDGLGRLYPPKVPCMPTQPPVY
jgi:hypothetical protein